MRVASLVAAAALLLPAAAAAQKTLADFPLRIHVYGHNQTTWYHNRYADESKGEGRANLFENGDVHGVDYTFDCDEKLKNNIGYETYAARWKKPGRELTVLLPKFGQTGKFYTCNFKTDVKDVAYVRRNGSFHTEPSSEFKAWMVKHDYDPEHGKNEPARLKKEDAAEADSN